ncbi:MAG: molybdenum ABC transporter ATP-binding protein [Cellvibrionaceae bacterium]
MPKALQIKFLLVYSNNKKAAPNSDNLFSLDVDIDIPATGITAIFGHSGSGKTTLLRAMAGLDVVEHGRMMIGNDVWQDSEKQIWVAPHQRSIGYVFQEASLLPHLSARRNLEYAVKRSKKIIESGIDNNALPIDFDYVVRLLGLEAILDRKPNQLSGGERQRVAIAQALLIQPKLLLMDEPLASLDSARKKEIIPYIEKLKTELQIPIIFVSHSPDEVARLADHLVVLEQGKVITSGDLKDTLARVDLPIKLGDETGVVVDVSIDAKDLKWKLMSAAFSGGKIWVKDQGEKIGDFARLRILAKDVSLSLTQHTDSSIANILSVSICDIKRSDDDGTALVKVMASDTVILSRITLRSLDHLNLKVGDTVWAQVKSVALIS